MGSVSYRTTGAWGPGTGYPLPAGDIDQSFYSLKQRADRVAAHPPVPTSGIADIRMSRKAISVFLTDGQRLGPFALPLPPKVWRGDWEGGMAYSAYDVFGVDGEGVFFVLKDFTASTDFDANDVNIQRVVGVPVNEATFRPVANVAEVTLALTMDIAGWYLRSNTGCIFTIPTDAVAGWDDGANFVKVTPSFA